MKLLIPAAIAGIDQGIKSIVRQYPSSYVIGEVPHLLRIRHVSNTGMAFSLLSGRTPLLVALSIALMVFMCLFVTRKMKLNLRAEIALFSLLGGGLGNLIDRMLFGKVTDYIEILLFRFPVFNLADIVITMSALVWLYLILNENYEKKSGEENGANH